MYIIKENNIILKNRAKIMVKTIVELILFLERK